LQPLIRPGSDVVATAKSQAPSTRFTFEGSRYRGKEMKRNNCLSTAARTVQKETPV
tara:strand:- start:460 stop:627 length:168 start_codon:yes stop_codon:yes gene_type:complete